MLHLYAALVLTTCASDFGTQPSYTIAVDATAPEGSPIAVDLFAPAGTITFMGVSSGNGPLPTPFGDVCLDFPLIALVVGVVPASGKLTYLCSIDCGSAMAGMVEYFQFAGVHPSAPEAIGLSNTAAMSFVSTMQDAEDFNVFVLGDAAIHNTDVHGAVAVGGDLVLQNMGIATVSASSTGYGLVVGQDLQFTNGQVYQGAVCVGGMSSTQSVGFLGGMPQACSPVDFSETGARLLEYSQELCALPANGTTTFQFGGLTLVGGDPVRNVFLVDGQQLLDAHTLQLQAPASSAVVVNIAGASAGFTNMGFFLSGVDKSRVLYNVCDAASVEIAGVGVLGSLLAPLSHVQFQNGNVDGQILAGSLTSFGETHLPLYAGCIEAF